MRSIKARFECRVHLDQQDVSDEALQSCLAPIRARCAEALRAEAQPGPRVRSARTLDACRNAYCSDRDWPVCSQPIPSDSEARGDQWKELFHAILRHDLHVDDAHLPAFEDGFRKLLRGFEPMPPFHILIVRDAEGVTTASVVEGSQHLVGRWIMQADHPKDADLAGLIALLDRRWPNAHRVEVQAYKEVLWKHAKRTISVLADAGITSLDFRVLAEIPRIEDDSDGAAKER